MEKILVISSSPQSIAALSPILYESRQGCNIDTANNGGQARRMLLAIEYDLVLINMPLSDETGATLGVDISLKTDVGIIILAPADEADFVQEQVEEYGVFVLPKPINKKSIFQAIGFVCTSRKRILRMRAKQNELQNKLDDLKVIDRAKCCLIQYLNMSEPQAHRYIEKQAMDMRTSRRIVAEDIIKTYEM